MLGYDVEIFEANGEKTISTSYPNIYILLWHASETHGLQKFDAVLSGFEIYTGWHCVWFWKWHDPRPVGWLNSVFVHLSV